jgi:RNA polymerase sigma factor for flagellar operon FliA
MYAYLRDAVDLLPERHRIVIVGYFLEDRTSLDLANFLGVTESRISQLRSEALEMLKEGIECQYDGVTPQPAEEGVGRVAKRKANYAHAISEASAWGDRLDHIDLDSPREPTLVLDADLADSI